MSSVTLGSQSLGNGQTIKAQLDDGIMIISYSGKKDHDMTDAERIGYMKFMDAMTEARSKKTPGSDFLRKNVAIVKEMTEKLTKETGSIDKAYLSRMKDPNLQPREFVYSGDKPSLSEKLADSNEDKTVAPSTISKKDTPPTDMSDETANAEKPTAPVKASTDVAKKQEKPSSVSVTPQPTQTPVKVTQTVANTTQTSSGFRNLGDPFSSGYHANLMSNINWVKTADKFTNYPDHVKIALGYLGLKEVPGNGNNEELIKIAESIGLTNFDDSQTWCAVFANYVAKQILGDKFIAPLNNRTVNLEQFGRKIDDSSQIHAYDWLFFLNNPAHGGIFLGYDKQGNYMVLGGNQNDEVNIMRIPASSPKPQIRRMFENVQGSENIAFSARPELSRFVVGSDASYT